MSGLEGRAPVWVGLDVVVEGALGVPVVGVGARGDSVELADFEELGGLLLSFVEVVPVEGLVEAGGVGVLDGLEGGVGAGGLLGGEREEVRP